MIKLINEEEIKEIIKTVGEQELPPYSRGHKDIVGVSMISEDGSNFLQGFAYVDLYEVKKGICGKILNVWVHPECRVLGYGNILLENLENNISDFCQVNYQSPMNIMFATTLSKSDQCIKINKVLENGKYELSSSSRGRFNFSKELTAFE